MDTAVAQSKIAVLAVASGPGLVKAFKSMGATAIITGLSAEVAQVLVGLGVELADLDTAGDLRSGLVRAERLLSPASPPEAGRPAARHR